MSNLTTMSTRVFIAAQNRVALRSERGSQTAEYGVTILVAVALALSVFALVTGGSFDAIISKLIKAVLDHAIGLVG